MLHKTLTFITLFSLLVSCKEKPKNDSETEDPPIEVTIQADGDLAEEETLRHYCFASRTATPAEMGETYNYQFTRLRIEEDGKVTGTLINAPYGTDGSRGSLSGVYREEEDLVKTTTTYLAEGEIYEEQRDYRIWDGLSTLDANGEAVLTVPAVSCEQYDAYLKEYQLGILRNRANTTDRTRLKKVSKLEEYGYTKEQLDQVRFLELEVDLDHDWNTREFLLYVMDPNTCGTGGCNLLVIDGHGKALSSTSVVKLPVYMPTSTTADMKLKGTWKKLYVWSQGFRELTPSNGAYPDNASMAPEFPENQLLGHPEKFQLVLDYLD